MLGPLEAYADGRGVTVAGGRQRALLLLLLVHAGEVVSSDRLTDLLWPGEPADEAQPALHVTVSRLRKALEPDRPAGERSDVIVTRAPGYALQATSTDAAEFEAAVEAAREAYRGGDLERAVSLHRDGVALWRGGAYAEVVDETWAQPEAQRLEELRLAAIEDRVDAELALGRHASLVPELEALVSRHPNRERLAGQLVLALYRAGRQADALAAYRAVREALVDQLGLEPAPELRRLQASVLAQDPALDAKPAGRSAAAAVETATRARAADPERKQVTVLVADIAPSPKLAGAVDAEELRRVMKVFQSIVHASVHRLEGTADRLTGDGVVAVFGAPAAHEDHARRACYAALHLRQELRTHSSELRVEGLDSAVRIGLDSGEVVFGAIDDGDSALTAVGSAVSTARVINQLAEPGQICLSGTTASLAGGWFTVRDSGEFSVAADARPMRVHKLIAARGAGDGGLVRRLSTFVGRDREMRMLDEAFEEARSGAAQVVGVVGEPGVGKTRLCREFVERQRTSGASVYYVAAQAHTRAVPLLPVLELLRAYFDIGERNSDHEARERIAARLRQLDPALVGDLGLLSDFLGVADPDQPPERMDPEARQRRMLALTTRITRAQAAREPTIVLIEDLHWLDGASEAFLGSLVEATPGARALLVLNFRPEYRASWMARSFYRQIALAPLGPAAAERMLVELLGSHASVAESLSLIRARAQGNAFFIEELVRSLVERGDVEAEAGVPPTVQAVLAARIDRLDPREKRVLQAAAVIGREFPAAILERVVDVEATELIEALGTLVAGEFVYEHDPYPDGVYAFKHPLTREVAYGSQLGDRRARVHGAVARAMVELYPDRLDERAAVVAEHWEAAGDALEAARWHARAAARAGTENAAQALVHWERVRELADGLLDSAEGLGLAMASRTVALHYGWRVGLSLDEAEVAFSEGRALGSQAPDDRAQALLVAGYAVVQGLGNGAAREYARLQREAQALAERSGDRALCLALAPGAYALFCTGDYREGVAMCDRALELAEGDTSLGAGINYVCPYAQCHALKAILRVSLGDLREADRLIVQARQIARSEGDAEVVGFSHLAGTLRAYFAGDPGAALDNALRAVELAEHMGGSWFRTYAWLVRAMAEGMRGDWQRALEACESSLTIAREGRTVEGHAWRRAVLAESFLGIGDPERARATAAEAVAHARSKGQVFNETFASLVLTRALLRGAASQPAEIEAAVGRALQLAQRSGGRAFEPLIHAELAELARRSGDQARCSRELEEARRLFTEIGASGHAARLGRELEVVA
ncbi:MAG: hypothetical protein QOF65_1590 [Thermoleophilaceae bacterium]|nr:hypothetical protein [Thermoleophilaceae bacterium]